MFIFFSVIINGDVNQTSVGEFVLSTLIGNPVAVTTVSRLTVPAHQGFQLRGENSHDPYGSYRDLMV